MNAAPLPAPSTFDEPAAAKRIGDIAILVVRNLYTAPSAPALQSLRQYVCPNFINECRTWKGARTFHEGIDTALWLADSRPIETVEVVNSSVHVDGKVGTAWAFVMLELRGKLGGSAGERVVSIFPFGCFPRRFPPQSSVHYRSVFCMRYSLYHF